MWNEDTIQNNPMKMAFKSKFIFFTFFFFSLFIHNCVYAKHPPIFQIKNVSLILPVAGIDSEMFLERSILYDPKNVIRDGLPWYGTIRDDWIPGGRVRKHYGIDYYDSTITVVAPAEGVIIAVGRNKRAGGSVRIQHQDSVTTLFVHLTQMMVNKGQKVNTGDTIAIISKHEGNAFETQLHFSILVDGLFRDPIKQLSPNLMKQHRIQTHLTRWEQTRESREKQRAKQVKEYLNGKP